MATRTTGATFQINNTTLYVTVVTLTINDNINFLENKKQGFERTNFRNKYRSEITAYFKKNNLDYLIDLTFRNINRLFALSFRNGDDSPTRNYFDDYYVPLVDIKDFNALIDNKPFFDQPVKNKHEVHEKLIEISRNNNYTARNWLDYFYHERS